MPCALAALLLLAAPAAALGPPPAAKVATGTFHFPPTPDRTPLPERYRLVVRAFPWRTDTKLRLPAIGVTVHRVRFPSPVKSKTPENNTVHAEYYRPEGKGPFPAVIVLDVTGGNQML